MSEQVVLNKDIPITDIYNSLLPVMESIISPDEPVISVLSNIAAILKEALKKVSWAGFYLRKEEYLFLGPYQGKLACNRILIGKGVCGTSALKNETIIVDDTDKFPGHIACDSSSRSEIVIPIAYDGIVYGVLDLDSTHYSAFDRDDKDHLEKIVNVIIRKIDLDKLKKIII
jgi:L-methionine (R)-S-oxide reductase